MTRGPCLCQRSACGTAVGSLTIYNCGHPPLLLLSPGRSGSQHTTAAATARPLTWQNRSAVASVHLGKLPRGDPSGWRLRPLARAILHYWTVSCCGRSRAGAQQEVAIAQPVFPPEALVDDRQTLRPEPVHCLVTARAIVVTGRVRLGKLARTAGCPSAERLSKARSIWCGCSSWTVRYNRRSTRATHSRCMPQGYSSSS